MVALQELCSEKVDRQKKVTDRDKWIQASISNICYRVSRESLWGQADDTTGFGGMLNTHATIENLLLDTSLFFKFYNNIIIQMNVFILPYHVTSMTTYVFSCNINSHIKHIAGILNVVTQTISKNCNITDILTVTTVDTDCSVKLSGLQ